MTAIATIISRYCSAHASDSLITSTKNHENSAQDLKIIPVRRWRGAMSFWGTAKTGNDWTIQDFLGEQVKLAENCSAPQDFADMVSEALNRIPAIINDGIGIHFTAYENHGDRTVPELFQITNLELMRDSTYRIHRGVTFRRETYAQIEVSSDRISREHHGKIEYRMRVMQYLEEGGVFFFNNGSTKWVNLALTGILQAFDVAAKEGKLRPIKDTIDHRKLISWPVEQVIKLQNDFFLKHAQLVGGQLHNLSISPEGNYESDTDDILILEGH